MDMTSAIIGAVVGGVTGAGISAAGALALFKGLRERVIALEAKNNALPIDYVPREQVDLKLEAISKMVYQIRHMIHGFLSGKTLGELALTSLEASADPMDPVSEAHLARVCPILSQKVHRAHAAFKAKTGSFFRVIQGLRTYAEQDALYAQSRTDPPTGPWATNARGGYSNHNFGMAVDCAPDVHGDLPYKPDWDAAHPDWKAMVACLKAEGLAWGGDWSGSVKADVDHFQLLATPNPTELDRENFAKGGLPAVWASYGVRGGVSIGPLSASAGLCPTPEERDKVIQIVVEDLAEGGPISKAIEGWQA